MQYEFFGPHVRGVSRKCYVHELISNMPKAALHSRQQRFYGQLPVHIVSVLTSKWSLAPSHTSHPSLANSTAVWMGVGGQH